MSKKTDLEILNNNIILLNDKLDTILERLDEIENTIAEQETYNPFSGYVGGAVSGTKASVPIHTGVAITGFIGSGGWTFSSTPPLMSTGVLPEYERKGSISG